MIAMLENTLRQGEQYESLIAGRDGVWQKTWHVAYPDEWIKAELARTTVEVHLTFIDGSQMKYRKKSQDGG